MAADQHPNEEDIKRMAAHLRKPEGEEGLQVGELMNDGNSGINMHSIAALHVIQGDKILEIGMGNGAFIKHFIYAEPDLSYIGFDYSDVMVEDAGKRNDELMQEYDVQFLKGNAADMPFTNEQFDKIMSVNTFYFWDDHAAVIKEINRVLRPNGSFILAVRPERNLKHYPVTAYNFTIWSTEKMLDFLKENGFSYIELTEIKEPSQELWGEKLPRECTIFRAYKD